jgi:class 3 adenylate cyclase
VEAERRQVTVLFTDMVGFTTFSERSGEEAAYNLMRSLSKLMGEAVRERSGIVQGFTGDGIMAVFGAPVAFEDAPHGPVERLSRSCSGSKPPSLDSSWRHREFHCVVYLIDK